MIRRADGPHAGPLPDLLGGAGEPLPADALGGAAAGEGAPVDDAAVAAREAEAAQVIAQLLGVRDRREAAAPASAAVVPERPVRLDELLLAAPGVRAGDPVAMAAALTAFLRRPVRPGESERLRKLRKLVARVLELKQEAGAGAARISIG